ncbi:MAG: hypothetical protein AAGE52_41880 [Myxococcota bacterium]
MARRYEGGNAHFRWSLERGPSPDSVSLHAVSLHGEGPILLDADGVRELAKALRLLADEIAPPPPYRS